MRHFHEVPHFPRVVTLILIQREPVPRESAETLRAAAPEPAGETTAGASQILTEREALARRSRIAAAVIKAHVDRDQRDLAALRKELQLALASPPV